MTEAPALREAGLRYTSDRDPGIARRRSGKSFSYFMPDGKPVKDAETLIRIRSLAIPPAYQRVWICLRENGHLQATGIDARGRKQYRYHPQWRAVRDADKFDRMLAFGKALPAIHRRVAADLRKPGMPREKVLAAVVRLLERTLIRVGNEQYVRENNSYGLTTLRNRHVAVKGDLIRFEFRGKAGIRHSVAVADPRAASVLRRCLELPGQELFLYLDEDGEPRQIASGDVNDYLRAIAGFDFTAKDFRTWYATEGVLETLLECEYGTQTEAKAFVNAALKETAQRLGNTPAMCRKCYVHPGVLQSYMAGELLHVARGTRRTGHGRERMLLLLRRISKAATGSAPASKKRRARTSASASGRSSPLRSSERRASWP